MAGVAAFSRVSADKGGGWTIGEEGAVAIRMEVAMNFDFQSPGKIGNEVG